MGVESRFSATITKTCDGCGERWEARATFSSASALLAFGGPAEASDWVIHITDGRQAKLLCSRCAEHLKGSP